MAYVGPVIVAATRTPTGRFLGGLSSLEATDLGGIVIREAIRRAGVPVERIDEVIMGNVVQAGAGQAPARQAALKGGVPGDVSAVTINMDLPEAPLPGFLRYPLALTGTPDLGARRLGLCSRGDLYVSHNSEARTSRA